MSSQRLILRDTLNSDAEVISGNGIRGPYLLDGAHAMAITGVLGGATIRFFHRAVRANGTDLDDCPQDTEMQFSTLPAPFEYNFSSALPLFFEVTNNSGTTALRVSASKIGE